MRCAGVARTLAALGDRSLANRDDVVEALSYRREQIASLA
jgi:predicted ATPase with chaperone activity